MFRTAQCGTSLLQHANEQELYYSPSIGLQFLSLQIYFVATSESKEKIMTYICAYTIYIYIYTYTYTYISLANGVERIRLRITKMTVC